MKNKPSLKSVLRKFLWLCGLALAGTLIVCLALCFTVELIDLLYPEPIRAEQTPQGVTSRRTRALITNAQLIEKLSQWPEPMDEGGK